MSPQLRARPVAARPTSDVVGPWLIVSFADGLVDQRSSTTTRLGIPFRLSEINDLLVGIEAVTNAAANVPHQFWETYLSSTESGVTYTPEPRPVREQVQRLRDEVVRRTRLTRQQIARGVGVDRRSLSSWVNGTTVPAAERLERLHYLAATVREIDALRPGQATEVLLARRRGGDILDLLAQSSFDRVRNWQALEPGQAAVNVTARQPERAKEPLYAAALKAYLDGRLSVPPRARTVREAAEYEQDLEGAGRLFPDDTQGPRRGRYR
jgi:transcriptional regulator with XRE-family HTH domain